MMNHEIQDPSFFPKSPTQPGKNNPDLVGNTFIRFIYPGDCDSKVSHHPCIDPRDDDTASGKTLGKNLALFQLICISFYSAHSFCLWPGSCSARGRAGSHQIDARFS